MSFFLPIGIFLLAVSLMAVMLARKNILLKQGAAFSHEMAKEEHFSRFFSSLHDLERALLHVSFRTSGHIFAHVSALFRRGVYALFHKTPMRRISNAVSGKKEINAGTTKPSAYLKDVTNHRDQLRENGSWK
ncbi:MAG: hypothetical protein AAB805_00850 [Patescibacteria group bacterium]